MSQVIWFISRNVDTTEGRGPMIPLDCSFTSKEQALRYVATLDCPYASSIDRKLPEIQRANEMIRQCWYKVEPLGLFETAEEANITKQQAEVEKIFNSVPANLRKQLAERLKKE